MKNHKEKVEIASGFQGDLYKYLAYKQMQPWAELEGWLMTVC